MEQVVNEKIRSWTQNGNLMALWSCSCKTIPVSHWYVTNCANTDAHPLGGGQFVQWILFHLLSKLKYRISMHKLIGKEKTTTISWVCGRMRQLIPVAHRKDGSTYLLMLTSEAGELLCELLLPSLLVVTDGGVSSRFETICVIHLHMICICTSRRTHITCPWTLHKSEGNSNSELVRRGPFRRVALQWIVSTPNTRLRNFYLFLLANYRVILKLKKKIILFQIHCMNDRHFQEVCWQRFWQQLEWFFFKDKWITQDYFKIANLAEAGALPG